MSKQCRNCGQINADWATECGRCDKSFGDKFRMWTPKEIFDRNEKDVIDQSDALEDRIRELLFGKHPSAQFLALVCLSAQWIANHHPADFREEIMIGFIDSLKDAVKTKATPP